MQGGLLAIPDDIVEEKSESTRKYISKLNQEASNLSLLKGELDDTLRLLEFHQDRTRDYMRKIEEISELVDTHICKPCNEQTTKSPDTR